MKNILIAFAVCVGLFILYRFFVSREGFQSTPTNTSTNNSTKITPMMSSQTSCLMMKLIQEKMQANLENALSTNDTIAINFAKTALESVKTESINAACV